MRITPILVVSHEFWHQINISLIEGATCYAMVG